MEKIITLRCRRLLQKIISNLRMAVEALKDVKERFDYDKFQEIADIIDDANNVFVAGRGRSRQTAMNFGSTPGTIRQKRLCSRYAYHTFH